MTRPLAILLLGVVACDVPQADVPSAFRSVAPEPAASASVLALAPAERVPIPDGDPDATSIVSFAADARVVARPSEWSPAELIIDGNPRSGWSSNRGHPTNQSITLELPEKSIIEQLRFDTGSVEAASYGAKEILVEVSDTSASEGFLPIASVVLDDKKDGQVFNPSAMVEGRWLRLVIAGPHGGRYTQLMELRARGKQLSRTPVADISGSWRGSESLHLRQDGTSVDGCYARFHGLVRGGIDGRTTTAGWSENDNQKRGPVVFVVSPDGKKLDALWWKEGNQGKESPGVWHFEKESDEVGACPHWKPGRVEEGLARELADKGRVRLYGINFDFDSDRLRSESQPLLEKVAALLKEQPTWTIDVEGHTDSAGGEVYNQGLSQRRAEAVVRALADRGVAVARLTHKGIGASQPVASNDDALGRQQNRRVELVNR